MFAESAARRSESARATWAAMRCLTSGLRPTVVVSPVAIQRCRPERLVMSAFHASVPLGAFCEPEGSRGRSGAE